MALVKKSNEFFLFGINAFDTLKLKKIILKNQNYKILSLIEGILYREIVSSSPCIFI